MPSAGVEPRRTSCSRGKYYSAGCGRVSHFGTLLDSETRLMKEPKRLAARQGLSAGEVDSPALQPLSFVVRVLLLLELFLVPEFGSKRSPKIGALQGSGEAAASRREELHFLKLSWLRIPVRNELFFVQASWLRKRSLKSCSMAGVERGRSGTVWSLEDSYFRKPFLCQAPGWGRSLEKRRQTSSGRGGLFSRKSFPFGWRSITFWSSHFGAPIGHPDSEY
jgi:hypothetical protein